MSPQGFKLTSYPYKEQGYYGTIKSTQKQATHFRDRMKLHSQPPSTRNITTALGLFLIAFFTGISAGLCASQTWDNGAANFIWDTNSLNWSGSIYTNGNDALFDVTGAGAISVTDTQSVGNITVNADGYSFNGGTLDNFKKTGFVIWTFNNDTTFASTQTLSYTSSTGTFNKTGPGKLTVAGTVLGVGYSPTTSTQWRINSGSTLELISGSSFTLTNSLFRVNGNTTISGGTHQFLGSITTHGIAVGDPSTTVLTVSGGSIYTVKLSLGFGTSSIYTQSGGVVTVSPDAFGVILGSAASATDTSTLNLDGGTLVARQIAINTNGVWLGTATINLNGGTFRANGQALSYGGNIFSTTNAGNPNLGNIYVKAGGVIIDSAGFSLTNGQALQADPISTGGGLTKLGAGSLTIVNPDNTYTGPTTVNAGILALSGNGSIATSTGIVVADGATFDVSGLNSTFVLGSGQMLSNSAAATGLLNGNLNTGSGTVSVSYTNGTPAFNVANGTLTLSSGTGFNVNNIGPALTAGSYKIIAQGAGGAVAGTLPSVTVSGGGIAGGASASLVVSGGELYLQVTSATLYPPVLSSMNLANGGVVLSFSGTNGQSYQVLSSTNLNIPLSNWTAVSSGTLTGSTINYTNAPATDPQRFFIITSP
jgi:autotransporter-associated beta strand protein